MISCPACAGVVRIEVGPRQHLGFVCSVGHAFSLQELYAAKEDQVESAQWSLLALLKHLQMILQIDEETDHRHVSSYRSHDLYQRLEQIGHQIAQLEGLIEGTDLPLRHQDGHGADRAPAEGP